MFRREVTFAGKRGYRFLRRYGVLDTPLGITKAIRRLIALPNYARDWRTYSALASDRLSLVDSYPILHERTATTSIERHYFHMASWASRLLAQNGAVRHVDVGSDHRMLAVLSAFVPVVFLDIRPLPVHVERLELLSGDILHLPLVTNSVPSLSCLHVAEHVGLGRYGDALNPSGTRETAAELSRVLAPGGNLYFALPVGRARIEFNAHRIHTPRQIVNYFDDLELVRFSAEDDNQRFIPAATLSDFERADYACGMFWFRKPSTNGLLK